MYYSSLFNVFGIWDFLCSLAFEVVDQIGDIIKSNNIFG